MGHSKLQRRQATFAAVPLIMLIIGLAGCSDEFLDPTQIGRFRPVPAVNVILDSLGVADETPSRWAAAEDPKPIDVMVFESDYTFGPGDIISVSIYELLQSGVTFSDTYVVTETGKISIPEVGVVEVAGLTESQLEQEIRDILSPTILKDPLVTVISLASERRTFSIQGNGVVNPGRYQIPRYDYRLNNALAVGGVAAEFNISYIYVTRIITERDLGYEAEAPMAEPQREPGEVTIPEEEMLEIIAPRASLYRPYADLIVSPAEMVTEKELTRAALPQDLDDLATEQRSSRPTPASSNATDKPIDSEQSQRIEWIFRDGKWVPVPVGKERPPEAAPEEFKVPQLPERPLRREIPTEFEWEQIGAGGVQTRVIKIPSDKLAGGDPRYNIVIRPGDTIHVPLDMIGEFYIMGNVNAQGAVNLTGRPITLKMAIAAAGGLGPLAWPKRCEVTRRIGKSREETVLVDLDKIGKGEEPDFFIKANDLVNVGTHPTSRWRAVVRNAFRTSYGFAFIYDRNFADREFGLRHPLGPFGF